MGVLMARVAFVTGASRGIGAASATALAASGHRLAVGWHRDADGAKATVAAIEAHGGEAVAVQLDVADVASVTAAHEQVTEALGPVEVLVSNAGITADGVFARMSEDRWRTVLAANLDGAYHVARRVVPAMMRNRWGRIITISSVGAYAGAAGQANYAASKAGLIGLTRALARELGPRDVTANVITPGVIATDMTATLGAARLDQITASVPLGRMGSPDDVAAVVVFLASESAAYITGAVVPVDGGLGMGF
ncbi:MAG: 3-oxoacyl-ACP reductase FabG [Acidimicrobiales bacterium]